jgi:aryl-alcohol dehydrogenase-like predicted oxidoreductase
MQYRVIGKTDIKVSGIGLSLAPLGEGAWHNQSESDLVRLFSTSFDSGINLFETGDTFGDGASEELLAKALSKKRDDILIATRVGYDIYHFTPRLQPQRGPVRNFSHPFLRYAVEKSLKRLKTDRIDILQLHHLRKEQVESVEIWETLERLQKEGKILHHGAVLGPDAGWVNEGVACIQTRNPTVIQHSYNYLNPNPGNLLHAAVYHPLSHPEAPMDELPRFHHGAMEKEPRYGTGFFISNPIPPQLFSPPISRSSKSVVPPENLSDRIAAIQRLAGKQTGRTAAQVALLWLLAEPTVASCFPAILNENDLAEFVVAFHKPLRSDERAVLDARIAE